MQAGLERLSVRWALALTGTYLLYLLALRVWCRWLLSRDNGDLELPLDAMDGLSSSNGSFGDSSLSSGAGGDFAGGGASGSFDGGAGIPDVGEVAQGALEVAAGADEGAVVVVPLAVVVLVAALIAGGIGFAVFGLFGIDVLLGVAVEIAFAAAGGAVAFRAGREGWLQHAASRTAGPLLGILLIGVALGVVIDHWLPQVNSLPQAIRAVLG